MLVVHIHLKINTVYWHAPICRASIKMNKLFVLFNFWDLVAREQRGALNVKEPYVSSSVFNLLMEGEDTCTLDPLQLHTLTSCGFNSSNPLIIITHGWSVRSTPHFSSTSLN